MPTLQPFPFDAFVVEAQFLGQTAAFALGDGTVRLVTGPVAESVPLHAGPILTAARSLDGRLLITGGDDGKVMQVDDTGVVKLLAERPKKWIEQIACGPGGLVAFGAGKQAIVRFPDGRERTFDHERTVTGLAFAPKGVRLAVARYGGVHLWWPNADAGAFILDWKGAHTGVTFSPDGRFVVTSMQENALHGWRIADGQGHLRMSGYPAKPKSLSWSVKGRYLASSGAEMAVVWPFHFKDGPQGKPPLQLGVREPFVTKVACHPSEEVVALGYADGAISVARFADRDAVMLRQPGDGPVSALAWDDEGTRMAFGTEQGAGGIIDIAG